MSGPHDIRTGMTIVYNEEPYQVLRANFVRMQQRKPVMQTKLKSLVSGKVLEYNFKPGDTIEEAQMEKRAVHFLYQTQNEFHFMDNTSYDEIIVAKELIGDAAHFLKEGQEMQIQFFQSNPIGIVLPPKLDFQVTSAAPGVKGDTAQGRITKQVTIETGYTLNAPLFIKEGDLIRINIESGEYVERVS